MNALTLPEDWEADALCAQVDPELFFPNKGQSTKEAKRICAACPVLEKCRERALSFDGEVFGIWGGTTGADRKLIKRQAREGAAA
ncbi:WhiB family transcription factor [Mycobacterium phage Hammy]|uniref:WhiB family transcription factor n=2 Tax=Amginevirus TaxID=2946794 RepID=A0A222ZNH8_9CAUD|nr:WhiB transcriptional factor [Mycobacterium phage Amohnition]YP_009952011.1 WhiB transcriptional factor [Mycobacterium phage DarthP]APD18216.1 WhiB family transcription factor [Mycobacterium phage Hammy]ASR86333.1 WhiB family transcription factor [Mycobacterium phage Amohnition]ASW31799.1 WhiB family transcription factor [Mycobacterium phage DarthP]